VQENNQRSIRISVADLDDVKPDAVGVNVPVNPGAVESDGGWIWG
jgi:hypothetical protein